MNESILDAYIIGFSGFAKEVSMLIRQNNEIEQIYDIKGYVSPSFEDVGKLIGSETIAVCDEELFTIDHKIAVFLGIGNPKVNESIFTRMRNVANLYFPNLIHNKASGDWERCTLGLGNIITCGCTFTTDFIIGDFNLFNLHTTLGHDVRIGNYNVINPSVNISGNVTLGSRIMVGTGAQILQGLSVCDDAIIGAGAVVTKHINSPGTYAGVPAIRIK